MPRTVAPCKPVDLQSAYSALRQGGAPPSAAVAQLGLDLVGARRLEAVFRARTDRGAGDAEAPKFARHEPHVRAVLAQGGYPAFSERRCGQGGARVCLPVRWPRARPEEFSS